MTDKVKWPKFERGATLMEKLVGISRFYGADPQFILAGGGNTSAKTDKVLYIKASGRSLATIDTDGFVALDRAKLAALLEEDLGEDPVRREQRFKEGILEARLEGAEGLRPSVECLLHNLLPQTFVVHTHSALANAVTCCADGEAIAKDLFGYSVIWIPACEPGHKLARAIAEAIAEFPKRTGMDSPDAVLMQNHGLLVCADEVEEIRVKTDAIIDKLRQCVEAAGDTPAFGKVSRVQPNKARGLINKIAPALRGLLADGEHLKIVTFDDSELAMGLVCGADGPAATDLGPLTPDQIIYSGSQPMWFQPDGDETDEQIVEGLRRAVADHKAKWNDSPMVVPVKGLGIFTAGDDFAWADNARVIYLNAIEVMAAASRLGGIAAMCEEHRRFIETWEAEAYRKKVAKAAALEGRAANKVAVVTGAAQGFGLEIAQDLARQGAYVALTDINPPGAVDAADEICKARGDERAVGLAIDVTDGESVGEAIHQVVRKYGGFDLFVSNAGVLKAESVKTQPVKDFAFVTDVNYKGYFVCVQNAAPVMAVQHLARPSCMSDIVQINSKSGLAGSNRNAAYSGSKFGGIGLTQSFALELIADGIKVNSICPGNFFDGPLWSDPDNGLFVQYLRTNKVPGAKSIADVRRAYEAKVPMGRGCTTDDVMVAVYYVMEQKYETGQAIAVTGGQVMLR